MNWLAIVGDAVWIVAMSLIASASRTAWRRIPDETPVPLQWRRGKAAAVRLSKRAAFGVTLATPLGFGLVLSGLVREGSATGDQELLLFLLRTATAPIAVLIHYAWLRATLETLSSEGALKP